jgi:mlo protein
MASGKSFTQTDSWAVAIAFVVFAILSVLIEKAVHWLKHSLHAKKTLLKVVHKAEEELFLLGSVSFILLVFEDALVANTCVKTSRFDEETWAMCPYVSSYDSSYAAYGASSHSRRRLAAAGDDDDACDDDAEPFLSRAVLHQVHLFIFFLALAHVCYTTATLTLGRWRLRNMLRQRRAHVERTMAVVSQLASADAHMLADRMMRTRTTVMREEARPSENVRDGGGAANGEKKKKKGTDDDAFGASPSRVDRPETAETDFEEGVTRLAADALRGDGAALGKTRRALFRSGLSRSSKHRYTPDGERAARAGSLVARARRALPSQNALLESIAVRLPESTLIRFELFFLRAHNVRSLKFDFPEYVMECIDWDSCDTLGMSPGRWCIATVIILVMGPFENINLIVSVVSVCVILGLAAWLKTRVDLVLRAEKRGDGVTDAQLFLLGRPRLAKELFIAILYQQAFHVATWIFGAWQIGVGDGYGCYYGQSWSVLVSAGTVLVSLLVGGYVILPLDALLAQMSGHFRSELLDARVTDVVKQLAASLERRRRGTRRFATQEQAVLHIQRAFRERKKRNLGRAAKLALMHAASGKMADRGRAGGGGDVRVDVGDDVR